MPTTPQHRAVPSVLIGDHERYRTIGDSFASGGVGELFRTDRPGYVFKHYKDPAKAPDIHQLESLVDTGRKILVTGGAKLGQNGATSIIWPVDIVRGPGGVTTGVLMPEIPAECFDGKEIRGLDGAIMARAKPPRAEARVALLVRMAEILAYLDSISLVHGDISGKNLAWWSAGADRLMFLIDCDGLMPQSPPPAVGVCTTGWTDPRLLDRMIHAHDHYSDRYALALAIYRGLLLTPGNLPKTAGKWQKPTQLHQISNAPLRKLLANALENPLDPGRRPTPKEFEEELRAVYVAKGSWNHKAINDLQTVSERNMDEHRKLSGPVPVVPAAKVLPTPVPFQTLPRPLPVPPRKAVAPPAKATRVGVGAGRAARNDLILSAAVYLAVFCALGAIVAKNVPMVARFLAGFRIPLAVGVVAAPSFAFGVLWAMRHYSLKLSGRSDSPVWFRAPIIGVSFAPMVAGTWGHLWGAQTTAGDLPSGDRWQQAFWFWRLCVPALAAVAALFAFERAGRGNRRRAPFALIGLALLIPVFTQGRPVVHSVADRARLLSTSVASAAAPNVPPADTTPQVVQPSPVQSVPSLPSLLVNGGFEAGIDNWTALAVNGGVVNELGYPGGVDGGAFLEFNTSTALGSIYQDVSTTVNAAQSYTFTLWLRSANAVPVDLNVTLFGLDGVAESASTPVSLADGTWQQFSVTLTPAVAHSVLRAEIYAGTPDVNVDLDQATLS